MSTPSRKRPLDEWDSLNDIKESPSASVHFVVSQLSPVKESGRNNKMTKYFDSQISDGTRTSVRTVSFDPSLRPDFELSLVNKTPINLQNCRVVPKQVAGCNDQFEILANSDSKIVVSPRKIDICEDAMPVQATTTTQLCQISDLANDQKVNILCKVVSLSGPQQVQTKDKSKDLQLQNVAIADVTANIQISLWNQDIGKLEEGKSYEIKAAKVKEFNGVKSLSGSYETTFKEVDDIGAVDETKAESIGFEILEGEIDLVVSIDQYPSCLLCKTKLIEVTEMIAKCKKCGSTMKLSKCSHQTCARVILDSRPGAEIILFSDIIDKLTNETSSSDLAIKLLSIPKHAFSINKNNVVFAIKQV